MAPRAKVVLTDYVWESLDMERKILGELGELTPFKSAKPDEFLAEAKDCDALLNTCAGPITAEVIAQMPKCRIIARYGIGVDTIGLEAATRSGIIVTNNPTYCIEEVAEHAMALLLAAARKIAFYDRAVRSGIWAVPSGKPIFRLAGSTLGLVGFGNIARQVAVRAAAFGMRVLFSDPFVQNGDFAEPGTKVELPELLAASDFVSLHPPLTPQTRFMMNDEAFARMKPTATLINCARGPVVNTDALVRALDEKKIAGCTLDTTDPEPLPNPHPLRGRENVIINPHTGWYSEQAMVGPQAGAPNEVRRVLSGEWPVNVVNRAVKGNNRAGLWFGIGKGQIQMKLLRYGTPGEEKPGMLDASGQIRDLSGVVSDIGPDSISPAGLAKLRAVAVETLPVVNGSPRYGTPLRGIGKFIAVGLNYSDHAAETGMAIPAEPILFTKAISCITGPNDPVVLPEGSTKGDWEAELGIVIGTTARYVAEDKALDYVAGFCVINDVSERQFQLERGSQWDRGKGCDTFGPIGPWLVTTDEVGDPQNLDVWLDLNGQRMQTGSTKTMIFGAAHLVSYISRFITLMPGDVITTGTPPGVGMGKKPQFFLKAGDVMTLGIQGLGSQRQEVRGFTPGFWETYPN